MLLAACGGGGDGAGAPPLGEQCLGGSVARLALPEAATVGSNAELAVLSCGPVLTDLRWTQTAGAPLGLRSVRSQALTFEPGEEGTIRFEVGLRDDQGRSHRGQVEIRAAAPATATSLVVRGEPSVWGGGTLSLRAWPQGLTAAERAGASVRWSVVDGPIVDLPQRDGWRLVFDAPSVGSDSLLRLRATVTLTDGRRLRQDFSLLVQPPPRPAANPLFGRSNPASRVYPYRTAGPYAAALSECVYAPHLSWSPNNLCDLKRLPLLGQSTGGRAPTVEQVMQRVLVSNDWMGEVFEDFLRTQDTHGDFRRLLNATTAVVIGARLRPSFYWNVTGAIYLDAGNLWLTPQQRDTVSEAPDRRSGYGDALRYATPWRYVLDNRYAAGINPVEERGTRDIAALRYDLGRLLYHELAHAGDFIPPRVHAVLRDDRQVWESSPTSTASQALAQQLPLSSSELLGLARVRYFGDTATAQQIGYVPADISGFFSADRASDFYSYAIPAGQTIPREDGAMLVEEAMMQLRFGVLRDVAVTPPLPPSGSAADLIVNWGQRGRVGDPAVRPRAALMLGDILPWLGAAAVDSLGTPLPLTPGLSWGENLDRAAIAAGRPRPLTAEERRIDADLAQRQADDRAHLRRAQAWDGRPRAD